MGRTGLIAGATLFATAAILLLSVVLFHSPPNNSSSSRTMLESSTASLSAFASWLPKRVHAMMDETISPCDDFHQYACGGWESTHPIKAGHSANNYAFKDDIWVLSSLHRVCVEDDSDVGQFYQACMNDTAIEEEGAGPLTAWFAAIDNLSDDISDALPPTATPSATSILSNLHLVGISPLFRTRVDLNPSDPSEYLLFFQPGGLSLAKYVYEAGARGGNGERVLSVSEEKTTRGSGGDMVRDGEEETGGEGGESSTVRKSALFGPDESDPYAAGQLEALGAFYAKGFMLSGVEDDEEAREMAREALGLEIDLATLGETAKDQAKYRRFPRLWNVEMMNKEFPCIDWSGFITTMGSETSLATKIRIAHPAIFSSFCYLLNRTPVSALKSYLKAQTLHKTADRLSEDFQLLYAALDRAENGGGFKRKRRVGMCVAETKRALPMRAGRAFVKKFLSKEAFTSASRIAKNVRSAFRRSIEAGGATSWMQDSTRSVAEEKLDEMFFEIGRPEEWDLEDFDLTDSYFANWVASREYHTRLQWDLLSEPVDRKRWRDSPATVNAYYQGGVNGIFVPAGIIHSPFFNLKAPAAHNYGSLGSIIGHEMVHAFDNRGRFFGPSGKFGEWWDPETISAYEEGEECLEQVYDGFQAAGLHLDGHRTLGENIADIGGVRASYDAFLASQKTPPSLFSRRLFWLSYAHSWCGNERQRVLWQYVHTGRHAPQKFRILGPLSQVEDFAKDFNCPVGSKMNPADKCVLW